MELHKNDNTTYQNTWDRTKVVIKNRFIALTVYIRKTPHLRNQKRKSKINLKQAEGRE